MHFVITIWVNVCTKTMTLSIIETMYYITMFLYRIGSLVSDYCSHITPVYYNFGLIFVFLSMISIINNYNVKMLLTDKLSASFLTLELHRSCVHTASPVLIISIEPEMQKSV